MERTINIDINGQFVRKDNKNAGVMGESNVTTLHITMDDTWRGYGKRIVWRNANGENPVSAVLFDVDSLPSDPLVYDTAIPSEPMEIPGWCSFTIEGYSEDGDVHKVAFSVSDRLYVAEADSFSKLSEPSPSETQQIFEALGKAEESVRASATEAKSWAVGGTGSRPGEDTDNSKYYAGKAEKSAAEAAGSEQSAEQSATSAGASATAAASSAGAAASSAAAASQSAASAGESASNASESERNAATSESAAAGSAAEAKKSEQAAAGSASSASASAGSASGSASSAAGSASTAAQKANAAASSASEASTAAGNAKSSETKAKTSETNAKASETASSNYMKGAQAAQQAIENMTVSVKTLAPGSTATATKTTAGGVVNIEYGIPRGEQGQGLTIYGYYSTIGELEEAVPSPKEGAAYGVGVIEPYDIYVWDAIHSTWKNNGPIQGPSGPQGENGSDGKAATVRVGSVTTGEPGSQASVSNGGTESDAVFNFTIPRGADGRDGAEGPAGADGKSAYQSAKEQGYTGTEAEFYAALVSLKDGPFLPLSGGTISAAVTLAASGWSSNAQTVTVSGVKATGQNVRLSPVTKADADAWASAGCWCTAQAENALTFTCETVPTQDIQLNVEMQEVQA